MQVNICGRDELISFHFHESTLNGSELHMNISSVRMELYSKPKSYRWSRQLNGCSLRAIAWNCNPLGNVEHTFGVCLNASQKKTDECCYNCSNIMDSLCKRLQPNIHLVAEANLTVFHAALWFRCCSNQRNMKQIIKCWLTKSTAVYMPSN